MSSIFICFLGSILFPIAYFLLPKEGRLAQPWLEHLLDMQKVERSSRSPPTYLSRCIHQNKHMHIATGFPFLPLFSNMMKWDQSLQPSAGTSPVPPIVNTVYRFSLKGIDAGIVIGHR